MDAGSCTCQWLRDQPAVREGDYTHIGLPVLTCIDRDHWWIVANFRENSLENVQPGQRAGLTINTYPGRIFPGAVEWVSGCKPRAGGAIGLTPSRGRATKLDRLSQRFSSADHPQVPAEYPFALGATATVAIYTQDKYWLNGVTQLWQRIEAMLEHLR